MLSNVIFNPCVGLCHQEVNVKSQLVFWLSVWNCTLLSQSLWALMSSPHRSEHWGHVILCLFMVNKTPLSAQWISTEGYESQLDKLSWQKGHRCERNITFFFYFSSSKHWRGRGRPRRKDSSWFMPNSGGGNSSRFGRHTSRKWWRYLHRFVCICGVGATQKRPACTSVELSHDLSVCIHRTRTASTGRCVPTCVFFGRAGCWRALDTRRALSAFLPTRGPRWWEVEANRSSGARCWLSCVDRR